MEKCKKHINKPDYSCTTCTNHIMMGMEEVNRIYEPDFNSDSGEQ